MLTLHRLGNRVWCMAGILQVDLQYDARKWSNKPDQPPGVEVILVSGERLRPFFGTDADLLRAYLEGEPVESRTYPLGPDARVVHLLGKEVPSSELTPP